MVEKFRFICVSNNGGDNNLNDSANVVQKSACSGCSRQTPTNELFFCKGCASNNSANKKVPIIPLESFTMGGDNRSLFVLLGRVLSQLRTNFCFKKLKK